MPQTERVSLAHIYKQDGCIHIDFSHDADRGFEIYGFLQCLVKNMEADLRGTMDTRKGDGY